MNIKYILGVIATIIVVVGYIPYIRDSITGKTKPHIYSWLVWTIVTAIAFALQLKGGAGFGAIVTLVTSILCLVVLILGFRNPDKNITKSDTIFLVMSLVSLVLWLVAKQPILAIILVTGTDVLGFIPTIRKAWNSPESETISFYVIGTVRLALSIIALEMYSFLSVFYPVCLLVSFAIVLVILLLRRGAVTHLKV